MRLLVVEDNIDFQRFLKTRLEEKCFAVDAVGDGNEGMRLATQNIYDLVLLDYSLPFKNGYEICRGIRQLGKCTPVIMISGTSDALHKVDGFNLGIDDYLVKPFFFEELLARVNAVLSRPPLRYNSTFSIDDLSIDTMSQKVTRGKNSIYLTRKEFTLLEYFMKNPGKIISRGEIIDHVWGTEIDRFSNTIEMHILNLRRKVDLPRKRKLIHNMPCRGYKISVYK